MNILLKTTRLRYLSKYKFLTKAYNRAIKGESYVSVISSNPSPLASPQYGNHLLRHRTQHHLNGDQKHIEREVRAFRDLLVRSGFDPQTLGCNTGCRSFSTSSHTFNKPQLDSPDNRENENEEDDKPDGKMPGSAVTMLLFWVSFIMYFTFKALSNEESNMIQFTSWNEFYYDMLAKGEVKEIIIHPEGERAEIWLHQGAVVKGQKVQNRVFHLKIANPYKFEGKVQKAEDELGISTNRSVPVSYKRTNGWLADMMVLAIIFLLFFAVIKNVGKIKTDAFNPAKMFANAGKAKFVRADLQTHKQGEAISFKDVAGLHEAKVEIMEFVDYIKQPDRFTKLGAKVPKGALLLGPPGCGKTLLAKALATEAKVPFLVMAGSEFVEMIGGLGAARVRSLFEEAGKKAPCIIYIDEIDAIGRKRSGNNWSDSSEEEHTLNQLLVEMDGMSSKKGVIMIGSTNRAEVLDQALLRPGRFDRHIMIDYPTLIERKEMFEMYLRHLKLAKLPDKYQDRLAQLSPGMTGADIANVCNEAALHAARTSKRTVDADDFEYAVERMVAGVEKKSKMLAGQEKKIVAYHEAGHALVGWLLEHTDPLLRVSIVPRTSNALGFAQYLPSDKKLHSQEELFERICMALGGRVAESLTFNSVTTGAQNDLQQVTKVAYAQIRELGMNERVGQMAFPAETGDSQGTRPYSKYLSDIIDQEARNLVAKAYKVTEKILLDNQEKLKVVAESLLENECLSYRDVEQLIGPPTYVKAELPELHKPS